MERHGDGCDGNDWHLSWLLSVWPKGRFALPAFKYYFRCQNNEGEEEQGPSTVIGFVK
jgi:hypothetical protein